MPIESVQNSCPPKPGVAANELLDCLGVIMNKVIQGFRYSVLALIAIPVLLLLVKSAHWWWLCCTTAPDQLCLVTTSNVVVKAGAHDVHLPKGLVFYPVNERETNDECYPGGQYKIYVSLETDGSNLNSIECPRGMTNLIYQLKK